MLPSFTWGRLIFMKDESIAITPSRLIQTRLVVKTYVYISFHGSMAAWPGEPQKGRVDLIRRVAWLGFQIDRIRRVRRVKIPVTLDDEYHETLMVGRSPYV